MTVLDWLIVAFQELAIDSAESAKENQAVHALLVPDPLLVTVSCTW